MHTMTQEIIETVSAQDMLHLLDKFFSRYLDCSEEQRAVLRIWTLHTHCFAAAHATAYLNICSAEKQAGKSLCLQLLGLVCAGPWLATSASPAIFTRKVTSQRPTVLLDQCETIFTRSARTKTCGLLTHVAFRGGTFSVPDGKTVHDLDVFCPKAFAGDFPLPIALQELCIPVTLYQNRDYGHLRKFRLQEARELAQPLFECMKGWAAENLQALKQAPPFPYLDLDITSFSPRQENAVEPLFHLTQLLGGDWTSKLQNALYRLFRSGISRQDLVYRTHVLADIRQIFEDSQAERLSTHQILEHLNNLQKRPWSEWNHGHPMTPRTLASMLRTLPIHAHNQRHDSGERGQGYDIDDFRIHWNVWLREYDKRLDARYEDPDPALFQPQT